jgi:hypothetical protein
MKTLEHKEKAPKHEFRSFADFRKRFYPKPIESESAELPAPEDVGGKLAQESLIRLQAALTAR